jgi:hypothetical protein
MLLSATAHACAIGIFMEAGDYFPETLACGSGTASQAGTERGSRRREPLSLAWRRSALSGEAALNLASECLRMSIEGIR